MADSSDQKTEQASARHLSKAMEEGRFARTPELSVVLMLTVAVGLILFIGQSSSEAVSEFATEIFCRFPAIAVRTDTVMALFGTMLLLFGKVLAPVLAATAGAAFLAGGLQTGFQLTPKVLGLHFERLDVSEGFSRVFDKSKFVHTGIDALKLLAISVSLYTGARNLVKDPIFIAPVETAYLAGFIGRTATAFLGRLIFALGVIGTVSFVYERFKTGKELMMTREEVKEEHRSSEGNALFKAFRRRTARRLIQKQMLQAVQTADVVVTNPTHYAVALKYERGKDKAPVVLAKGENRFARRIKAIAAENGVPMVEDKPVARMLYALGRVGEPIPSEVYQAVAKILAVVYRTNRYYFHRLKARRLENAA